MTFDEQMWAKFGRYLVWWYFAVGMLSGALQYWIWTR